MPRVSSGLLMFRMAGDQLEVLLVHPGGPYYWNKDDGAWTIPKGELLDGEEPLAAAEREFNEETGFVAAPPYLTLSDVHTRSGKLIHAWAFRGDCDPASLNSNTFSMMWPPGSGQIQRFPEVDQAAFFDLVTAGQKIHPAQRPWLNELAEQIRDSGTHPDA